MASGWAVLENEKDITLTAIRVGVKILQFLFGLQHPLTRKPLITFSNPYNKVRSTYIYKEVFLRASLLLCRYDAVDDNITPLLPYGRSKSRTARSKHTLGQLCEDTECSPEDRWTIRRSGERGSRISVQAAHDDDDILFTSNHLYANSNMYQVLLSNTDYLHTVLWFQIFLSNTHSLLVVWIF